MQLVRSLALFSPWRTEVFPELFSCILSRHEGNRHCQGNIIRSDESKNTLLSGSALCFPLKWLGMFREAPNIANPSHTPWSGPLSGSFTYHFLVETEWLSETERRVEQSAFLLMMGGVVTLSLSFNETQSNTVQDYFYFCLSIHCSSLSAGVISQSI